MAVRDGESVWSQFARPPGGRDARTMLLAQFVDRAGTGVWATSAVLYLTFVAHLSVGSIGLLLGAGGIAGIVGSPLAGRLATRFPARRVLIASHLVRLALVGLMLSSSSMAALVPAVAGTALCERGAKMLEMLFATRVAGERRSSYQALARTSANAGYALGAGVSALGLAWGTDEAYRILLLLNGASYLAAALLVRRTREPRPVTPAPVASSADPAPPAAAPAAGTAAAAAEVTSPWRDRGYLLFVLRDIPLCLDDSVLNVGLPLWLVAHTTAPHALVPAFLIINTVLVVVLQLRVSAAAEGPRRAARSVRWYGLALLLTCGTLAASGLGGGALAASAALLAASVLVTVAELVRSVSSWELSVSLAPAEARAGYLGVAGMSQSIQKSAGPPLLTGVVMAAGPVGWLAMGLAVTGVALLQSRACTRRLTAMAAAPSVRTGWCPCGRWPAMPERHRASENRSFPRRPRPGYGRDQAGTPADATHRGGSS